MSCDVMLRETVIKSARKEYECVASLWIECLSRYDLNNMLTFSEKRAYLIAKSHGFKVLIGEPYVKQVQVDDCGDLFVYRAIPAMNSICYDYDLFEQ